MRASSQGKPMISSFEWARLLFGTVGMWGAFGEALEQPKPGEEVQHLLAAPS